MEQPRGAKWGSVSWPRTIWHERGAKDQTTDLPITRSLLYLKHANTRYESDASVLFYRDVNSVYYMELTGMILYKVAWDWIWLKGYKTDLS